MSEPFDPYHKWLGIPPAEQPPHHYRLLGLGLFEGDADVIEAAADRQMSHVQTYKMGPHSALSQRLLNELAAARVCLLSPARKAEYDGQLRAKLPAQQTMVPAAPPPPPVMQAPPPPPIVAPAGPAAVAPRVAARPAPFIVADSAATGGSSQHYRRQRQQARFVQWVLLAAVGVAIAGASAGVWWWRRQAAEAALQLPLDSVPAAPDQPATSPEGEPNAASPPDEPAADPKFFPPDSDTTRTPPGIPSPVGRAARGKFRRMEESRRLEGHTDSVTCLAISPDRLILVSASRDRSIRTWDTRSGRPRHLLAGHEQPVLCLAVSSDGERCVSAGADAAIFHWNLKTGELLRRLPAAVASVGGLALSPDGQRVFFSGQQDGKHQVMQWKLDDGTPIGNPLEVPAAVQSLVVSHDGDVLAAAMADGATRVWLGKHPDKLPLDLKDQRYFDFKHPDQIPTLCLAFSPDDRLLLGGSRDCTCFLADVGENRQVGSLLGHTSPVQAAVFSDDGRLVLTASGPQADDAARRDGECAVRVWDTANRRQLASFEGHTAAVRAVVFGSSARVGFSAGDDKVIREWRLAGIKSSDEPDVDE